MGLPPPSNQPNSPSTQAPTEAPTHHVVPEQHHADLADDHALLQHHEQVKHTVETAQLEEAQHANVHASRVVCTVLHAHGGAYHTIEGDGGHEVYPE